MRLFKSIIFVASVIVFSSGFMNTSMAYIGLPDLMYDISGWVDYSGATQKLLVEAIPFAVTFDGVMGNEVWVNPTLPRHFYLNAQLEKISDGDWYFIGDSDSQPDIMITGYLINPPYTTQTGNLILGDIIRLSMSNGILTGNFIITGGDLYNYFAKTNYMGILDIGPLAFSVAPTDENSNWHSTSAKGNIAPIPEPGTMLIFGLGLLGMISFKRKFI